MSLSQELLDKIMLDADDFETLKSCALVAQNWAPTSQKLLFQRVKLDHAKFSIYERQLHSLGKVIKDHPEIADYVRDLHVQWAFIEFHREELQLRFPKLETLTMKNISYVQSVDEVFEWHKDIFTPPSLRVVNLIDLTFDNIDKVSLFFKHVGPNVEKLQLRRFCILSQLNPRSEDDHGSDRYGYSRRKREKETEDTKKTNESTTKEILREAKSKLRTLHIVRGAPSLMATWFSDEQCPFDISNLEDLKYEEEFADLSNLSKILTPCRKKLTKLEVFAPRTPLKLETRNVDISPSMLPELVDLTISGIAPYSIQNAIFWLSQLNQNSKIKKLTLRYTFSSLVVDKDDNFPETWDLDLLVDNLPLTSLEEIEIQIPKRFQTSVKKVGNICRAHFPKLTERSICNVVVV